MQKIIGRENEMAELRRCVESDRSEFVIVYGRRRVGKTFLVDSFFNRNYDFSYVGGHKLSKEKQLRGFAKALKQAAGLEAMPKFADWSDAFDALEEYIDTLPKNRKKIIFIDEMPWIDTPQSEFVEGLETFWNGWGARRDDIVFIASGSASSWMMDKLVDNPGGLHARITNHIYVRPFTLEQTREYLHSRKIIWDTYQILQLYMIMGGVPFYLSLLNPKESMAENIDRLFFRKNGVLRAEFDELYNAIFTNSKRYLDVVNLLYNNKDGYTYTEVSKALKIEGDRLTIILKNLERCDFIISYTQYGNKSKGTIYRLVDFYTLFYYKFLRENDGKDELWWTHNITGKSLESWQGRSFELVCLTHLPQIKKALGIEGIATSASSWRYYGNKESGKKGAQIDLVIDRADRLINLCEIKFSKTRYTITGDYHNRLLERKLLFGDLDTSSKGLVSTFITTYGVAEGIHRSIVDNEITAEQLFE